MRRIYAVRPAAAGSMLRCPPALQRFRRGRAVAAAGRDRAGWAGGRRGPPRPPRPPEFHSRAYKTRAAHAETLREPAAAILSAAPPPLGSPPLADMAASGAAAAGLRAGIARRGMLRAGLALHALARIANSNGACKRHAARRARPCAHFAPP